MLLCRKKSYPGQQQQQPPPQCSYSSCVFFLILFPISHSLIPLYVCLHLLSPFHLLWYDIIVPYFSVASNSGVRQEACSALVLLINNSIRHGLKRQLCSAFLLFDEMVQWKRRRVIHLNTLESQWKLVCLFVRLRNEKPYIILMINMYFLWLSDFCHW